MCSEKLTDSQISLPHGMNKKCKRKTKNKLKHDKSDPVPLSMQAVQWVKK